MRRKRKPTKDKQSIVKKNWNENYVHIAANIPEETFALIKASNMSNNKAINEALQSYYRDYFKNRLEQALFALYEVMFDLERLKEKGQMGSVKCGPEHLLQIESYKEAIRILENSPLFLPPESDTI